MEASQRFGRLLQGSPLRSACETETDRFPAPPRCLDEAIARRLRP